MATIKTVRDLAILAQGAGLRAQALASERDFNEAYLMAHRVLARAFDDSASASSRVALGGAMADEIGRHAAGKISHAVTA
jgi:hypothetical protein